MPRQMKIAMSPEGTPYRIKGTVLAGHALEANLMSKITSLQSHEFHNTTTGKISKRSESEVPGHADLMRELGG